MTISGQEFPILLDRGAEISVLSVETCRFFQPPVQIPTLTRKFLTFGASKVTLVGYTTLEVSICGIQVIHPFYFIHDRAVPLTGYDFMEAARLVVDADNQLLWSRRNPASISISSNPSMSVPNPPVHSCVRFVQPYSSVVDSSVSAPVSDHQVETTSLLPSIVVSRHVSVVLPPLGCRASFLNPYAPPFRPRANSSSSRPDAPCPRAGPSSPQSRSQPVCPLVDPDDTLVKLPHPGSIISVTPPPDETLVPPHLQELFDATVDNARLSSSVHQDLAALLHRNTDAFATWYLGFCFLLQHDIDVGDAHPIKQSPRRPPFAALEAEDAILDEVLQSGIIDPSNSPWSSTVCIVKKKDDNYRFCIDYRRLNDVTKKDAFPVPDIKDALKTVCEVRNTSPR